jgi:hypothetical protein
LATQFRQDADVSIRGAIDLVASVNRDFLALLLLESLPRWPTIADIIRPRADCVPLLVNACPFALFDVRFRDIDSWVSMSATPVDYEHVTAQVDVCTCQVLGAACFLSWHFARHFPNAAALLLKISPEVIHTISSLTPVRLQQISFERPAWLQPRWSNRPDIWREIVLLAGSQPANQTLLRSCAVSLFLGDTDATISPPDLEQG